MGRGMKKIKQLKKGKEQIKLKVEDIEIQNVKKVDKVISGIALLSVSLPFIAMGLLGIERHRKAEFIVWTLSWLGVLVILCRVYGFVKELKQENINVLNKIENLDKNKILYLNTNHKIQDADKVKEIVSERKADIYLELLGIEVYFVEKTGEIIINTGFVISAAVLVLISLVREDSILEIARITVPNVMAYSLILGVSVGYLRLGFFRDSCNTRRWQIIYSYFKDYLSIEAEPYKKTAWWQKIIKKFTKA